MVNKTRKENSSQRYSSKLDNYTTFENFFTQTNDLLHSSSIKKKNRANVAQFTTYGNIRSLFKVHLAYGNISMSILLHYSSYDEKNIVQRGTSSPQQISSLFFLYYVCTFQPRHEMLMYCIILSK